MASLARHSNQASDRIVCFYIHNTALIHKPSLIHNTHPPAPPQPSQYFPITILPLGSLMFPKGSSVQALIVGGRGAIGGALASQLEKLAADQNLKLTSVVTSRDQGFVDSVNEGSSGGHRTAYVLNPSCEKSFAAFTSELKKLDFKPNLIFNACGLLHDHKKDIRPEVSFRKVSEEAMLETISTITTT